MPKRIFINNQIKADKVRLIGPDGKQLGIFNLEEALKRSRQAGLDLIKITEKVQPPVCKMMDYGKYLYQQSKKEKKQRRVQAGELKNIRLTFNISEHDMTTRVKTAEKFLTKGYKVRIELVLKGRQKAHPDFAKQKLNQFLEFLQKSIPIKVERELKKQPRGFNMIISKT
ncbi:translation initiation factor IF-3 [bacterium]|nr:translation initiation factor IF-3 [bacterium]